MPLSPSVSPSLRKRQSWNWAFFFSPLLLVFPFFELCICLTYDGHQRPRPTGSLVRPLSLPLPPRSRQPSPRCVVARPPPSISVAHHRLDQWLPVPVAARRSGLSQARAAVASLAAHSDPSHRRRRPRSGRGRLRLQSLFVGGNSTRAGATRGRWTR